MASGNISLSEKTDSPSSHLLDMLVVSDDVLLIIQWATYGSVLLVVAAFGAVTNIINIICFVKQGLKDPVNVSLLGLAVSDFGSLLTTIGLGICYTPAFQSADLPFRPVEFQYLTFGWPHIMFVRITSWITALITVERCLCITLPLKISSIMTSKRVSVTIVIIFVLCAGGISPLYYANRYVMKFTPERNLTFLTLIFTDDRVLVENISFVINNEVSSLGAFLTVIICTIILVVSLRRKARWRLKSTAPSKAEMISDRDQRVSRMVVIISTLFIVCFMPMSLAFIGMIVNSDMAVAGKYENTLSAIGGVVLLLESVNSGLNMVIYFHMSSRYKSVCRQLFQ